MTNPIPSNDDERLQRLARSLDDDAAPVDESRLAQIRELTLEALVPPDDVEPDNVQPDAAPDDDRVDALNNGAPQKTSNPPQTTRVNRMLTLAVRTALSLTALTAGALFWHFGGGNATADSTLGVYLDELRDSKSLQIRILRDGNAADVWIRQDGQLRWQESPTKYRISDGKSLWLIDEQANSATEATDENLTAAAKAVDVLALAGLNRDQTVSLRAARPSGTVDEDGATLQRYRSKTRIGETQLLCEAFVDIDTQQLTRIVGWPAAATSRRVPVFEINLVARDVELQAHQFEWANSLTPDGRIGKTVDRQGIVFLRPKAQRRWTPVSRRMRLKPGDQLRTDVRGANAVAAKLSSGATITVGPGTLAELVSPHFIRLHYGELQVVDGKTGKIEVHGPVTDSVRPESDDAALYLVDRDHNLATLKQKPQWLLGFEGASANESIGSLITKIDGRDVPLTIGYHKVRVEIRDQIARTTIEESFVNRTKQRLEGVFHFPLPQDASISGFGMWIGGELVEADVVEKQRAREIYETILREKRDPGLLEWTGGNIFKARVFPIEPRSEKRIKIVYTQVLPLRANAYRYSYALRSEMLRKTPLRELSIDVLLHSAIPLKSVASPSHPARIQQTRHSAQVQFSAQEYSPKRDFELTVGIDGKTNDVVTIPHQRGEDGYFMVQLTPPSAEGNWQRDVLPDGDPLDVLLVCDTSGSMDRDNRETQNEFVASVLASLGPDDKFNIAVCDANCLWLFDESAAATEDNTERARAWLAERISLGWTDLDAAFTSIQNYIQPKSHVIYVGDGVVSARAVKSQEFATRVRRLYGENPSATFHAVSTGSSFESVVLQAIASIGRGSVRAIGSGETPQSVALQLLNEMAQPGLRDLSIEFRGIEVAAIYPDELPNLAAGTQQILIGRYLPTGEDQIGEIIVTGRRGDETVKYSTQIPLEDAEKGNSFIPRLWARAHLDHLLLQGSNQAIRDEVIGLSEEFHIMTPYTSLLVLESDADRERFGVKRRFEMRDGERFFAKGRSEATMELLQQVLREAGNWRLQLRSQVVRQFARLGRDYDVGSMLQRLTNATDVFAVAGMGERGQSAFGGTFTGTGGGGGLGGGGFLPMNGRFGGQLMLEDEVLARSTRGRLGRIEAEMAGEFDFAEKANFEPADLESNERMVWDEQAEIISVDESRHGLSFDVNGMSDFGRRSGRRSQGRADNGVLRDLRTVLSKSAAQLSAARPRRELFKQLREAGSRYGSGQSIAWIDFLMPTLPPPPRRITRPPQTPSDWPEEAIEISRSLLRDEWLKNLEPALAIDVASQSFDTRWNRQTHASSTLTLHSKNAWLTRTGLPSYGKTVHWFNAKERGVLRQDFGLGQVRKSKPRDKQTSIPLGQYAFGTPLHVSYANYTVEVVSAETTVQLLLTSRDSRRSQHRITIDREKRLIVKSETLLDDKVNGTTNYSDLVEVAGAWWPRKVERLDEQGRVFSSSTASIQELTAEKFAERMAAELQLREEVQVVRHPIPSLAKSEVAAQNGSAEFEHRFVLLIRFALIQKWESVFEQLDAMEQLLGDKTAAQWIRLEVLKSARRNAQALDVLRKIAQGLADQQPAELARANHLMNSAWSIANANEVHELLLLLRPVYARQPEYLGAAWTADDHELRYLRSVTHMTELLAKSRTYAEAQPWNVSVQIQRASDLAESGDFAAAYEWIQQSLELGMGRRQDYQRDQLWTKWADLLRSQGESKELLRVMNEWVKEEPKSTNAYSRYLSTLIFEDKVAEARQTALKWLEEARIEGRLTEAARSRCNSAIQFALGHGWNRHSNVVYPRWYKPLQETATFFLHHEHHFEYASQVLNWHQFSNTDAADVVRTTIFESLQRDAATLDPNRINAFVNWVRGRSPARTPEDWQPIIAVIRQRWNDTPHTDRGRDDKHTLGAVLRSLYVSIAKAEHVPFMREQIAKAHSRWHDRYVQDLFSHRLHQRWTQEIEDELFALLPQLGKEAPASQLAVQVRAAAQLTDGLLKNRTKVATDALQDTGHPEKLTRQELLKKRTDILKSTREAIGDRLRAEGNKHDGLLKDWLHMDALFLDVQLQRRRDEVIAGCFAVLGDAPEPSKEVDEDAMTDDEVRREAIRQFVLGALRYRAFVTNAFLASQKSAAPPLKERLVSYVDAGIGLGGDDNASWKIAKFYLLIAFDEPAQLDGVIRAWIRKDEHVATWQRFLAYLAAERGELDEAIQLFDAVAKTSQLSAGDYTALAKWHLVRDNKTAYRRAKIDAFLSSPEYQLRNFVNQRRYRWENGSTKLPSELDERVLFAFQALFEKSANPGNDLSSLRDFYRACQDFRLLQMLPDAVVGRTHQQVYSFLSGLHRTVLKDVHKEATTDEILARIEALRETDLTAIDRRALDLFEALVERRASEVLNQPGPHIERALAALKRAFQGDWAPGEGRQMAEFLNSLGKLKHGELAAEQLRQMAELHRREEPGSDDRLFTGWYLANVTFSPYGKRVEGLRRMRIVIREYMESHPDGWPAHANAPLSGFVKMFEQLQRHADAEKHVKLHLENPLNNRQRYWLMERLTSVYTSALAAGTRVSLGEGLELYRNLIPFIVEYAEKGDDNHRYNVLQRLSSVFRTAKRKQLPFKQELRAYAFETLPRFLKRQRNHYRSLVQHVANVLRQLIGPRDGLEFLITRMEVYPERFANTWEAGWNQFGYSIADWRQRAGELGDLEPRLLKLVLDELRRDLTTRNQHNRYLYRKHSYFWSEKEKDFARTAEEVLRENRRSARAVRYIADYFWSGLHHRDRAIEILFVALRDDQLDDSGRAKLVDWLHYPSIRRYAESIAILEGLVERHAKNMHYRCELITAYHHTSRGEQRSELMKETIALFRNDGLWNESNLSQLARCAHDNSLNRRAVQLIGELIPMHQRSQPNRGIGRGTLSTYYMWLSTSHSRLKQTKEAVDAAAAAVVSWGPRIEQRSSAVGQLERVLRDAEDLDAYVAHLDEQSKASLQDSSLIRKAIGKAYAKKNQHQQAIAQFRIAVDLQPGDLKTHEALLASYDALGDKDGKVRQLLELIDVDRHALENYVKLAKLVVDNEDLAERAATSIVEAAPSEAEHHEQLAILRGTQMRHADAVLHWNQVAELRSLEPNGLINLAKAQFHAKRPKAAQRSIDRLRKTDWPTRFRNDVDKALRELDALKQNATQ